VRFAAGFSNPLILQAQHPLLDKSPGFVPNDGTLYASLPAALRDGFREEHHRTNDLVTVLQGISKSEPQLGKLFG
jgi:hypothetical protein